MSQVSFNGQSVTVNGAFPEVGRAAPGFTLTDGNLQDVSLSDYGSKRKILNIIPSIDTGVCAASTRKFNEHASTLANTEVLIVSADLPFAAGRFCGAEGLDHVTPLSLFRHPGFRDNYGVAISDGPLAGLCARAVLVLDEQNTVLHAQLVDKIEQEPDYDTALQALD